MGLLRALRGGRVQPGLGRKVVFAEYLADLGARRLDRLVGQVRRVRPHVRDVAVLVERLGRAHRVAGAHPQLARRLLLEGGRRERRGRPARVRFGLDGGDRGRGVRDRAGDRLGLGLAEGPRVLLDQGAAVVEVLPRGDAGPVHGHELGVEALRALDERGRHIPVGSRLESHALALALDDEAGGHGLDSARRQARCHLAPQERGDFIADETVEDAPRLLRVDQLHVDLARIVQGAGYGFGSDLMEGHSLDRDLGLEHLVQVPGDRLSLAVLVGGQEELVGGLQESAQLGDDLLLVRIDDVVGLEAVVHVHRELAERALLHVGGQLGGLRQIPDMTDRGLDGIARPEIAADRARLGRGFDNHEFGHAGSLTTVRVRGHHTPWKGSVPFSCSQCPRRCPAREPASGSCRAAPPATRRRRAGAPARL